MSNSLKPIWTRFRAYQLGQEGASFSYFAAGKFTLIESMATDVNKKQLLDELKICGKNTIDTLHLTSWDIDHCSESGLEWVLEYLTPQRIEFPGYVPHHDCAERCLKLIRSYRQKKLQSGKQVTVQAIDPDYIAELPTAEDLGYRNIFYHPKVLKNDSNNNSTIKLFRTGSFNVLSLGDVEDPSIAAMLKRDKYLRREVDVMILAHHGADNGFTTKAFLEALSPKVAICTSNYANKFDHPRQEIRDMLHELRIPLYTTKTGDVLIESTGSHARYAQVTNLCSNSEKVSSTLEFSSKKFHFLSMNADSLRNLLHPGAKGPRR